MVRSEDADLFRSAIVIAVNAKGCREEEKYRQQGLRPLPKTVGRGFRADA